MTEESKKLFPTDSAAAALIRVGLGVLFLTAGLNKFLSPDGALAVSAMMQGGFDKTWLPHIMTVPFLYAVPFIEVPLGLLLILGIATPYVLTLSGLYLMALAFGMMVQKEIGVVANNFMYLLMTAVGLWLSGRGNIFSVDHMVRRQKKL